MARKTREDQGIVYNCSAYLRQRWLVAVLDAEDGRVEFLSEVGTELDRVNARIEHRRAWADLLKRA